MRGSLRQRSSLDSGLQRNREMTLFVTSREEMKETKRFGMVMREERQ